MKKKKIKMEDKQENINLNEAEIVDLKRALNCLSEVENDTIDYTELINKLNTYYD